MKKNSCLFLFGLAANHVFALPTSDGDAIEPAWVPEPRGRGTAGILFSCVITITLCVWTAIHIDIIPNPTKRKLFARKMLWMFMSLLAPEVVLFCAFRQWLNARKLRREWCEHFKVKPGTDGDLLGMEGAFFAQMGGFTLGPSENFSTYPSTLTPDGFLHFTRSGDIPLTVHNKKLIVDKGKADFAAKLLVCVQALWMVTQSATRKAKGLPVTLLEFHVTIHVLCTVLMYVFWWYKPLDVSHPIPVIKDRDLGSLLSIVYGDINQPNKIGYGQYYRRHGIDFKVIPPPESPNTPDTPLQTHCLRWSASTETLFTETDYEINKVIIIKRNDSKVYVKAPRFLLQKVILQGKEEFLESTSAGTVVLFPGDLLAIENKFSITYDGPERQGPGDICELNSVDIENFRLAAGALRGARYQQHVKISDDLKTIEVQQKEAQFVTYQAASVLSQITSDGHALEFPGFTTSPGPWLLFFCLLYAGVHSIAWNNHFPTTLENLLWRVSCVILAASPPVWFAIDTAYVKFRHLIPARQRWKQFLLAWLEKSSIRVEDIVEDIGFGHFLCLFLLPNMFSRVYLTVEVFISMRSLPKGSYETISWEDYWPHF